MAPELVTALPASIISIGAGSHHSVAVDEDGFVSTWGHSEYGQHGVAIDGHDLYETRKYFVPVKHSALHDIVSVVCGAHFTVATDVHGVLHSWGWNAFGVLGTGYFQGTTLPQPIDQLRGYSVHHTRAGYNQCGAIVQYLGLPYAMRLRPLLAAGTHADVTLQLAGSPVLVPAHKILLKARCPHLYGYVRVALAQAPPPNDGTSTVPVVELDLPDLPQLDVPVLKALLAYLYADRLELSSHKIPALTAVATAFGLTDLVARCAHHRKRFGVVAPEPHSCFSRDLATVVGDAAEADVFFAWPGGRRVAAHKALLAHVPFFDTLVSGRFRELSSGDDATVSLAGMAADGHDVDVFVRALAWVYAGDRALVDDLDLDQVVDLVVMANLLGIESLTSVCTLHLAAVVATTHDPDLISMCFDVADRLDLQRLKTQCQVLLDAMHHGQDSF